MGYGYNARAALITRGLAEIGRLGVAMGGRPETFMGLTGAGDLILTCTGDLSRNRTVGLRLAQGQKLDTILDRTGAYRRGRAIARARKSRLAEHECGNADQPRSVPGALRGDASRQGGGRAAQPRTQGGVKNSPEF